MTRGVRAALVGFVLAGCGPDASMLVVVEGEGFTPGEVAQLRLELRDENGSVLGGGTFEPPPAAQFPFTVDVQLDDPEAVAFAVVELRGRREILARVGFDVQPGDGEVLETHVKVSRNVFQEGCADLDGDGFGRGPDCFGEDCDDSGAGSNPSATETCADGFDNNCDGAIDEGCPCEAGQVVACRSSPAGAIGLGPCATGTMACGEDGLFGECLGEITPLPEAVGVSGLDDDCDGVYDEIEGCEEGDAVPCYSGPAGTAGKGMCRHGAATCVDGRWTECEDEVQPVDELCGSELDEDCDGQVDEADACLGGPVVFELAPDDLAGFTSTGGAVDPSPCEDEVAFAVTGGAITFQVAGLALSGAAYAEVSLELSVRPELAAVSVKYETAEGAGELSEDVELVLEPSTVCTEPEWLDLLAPWTEDETITGLTITLTCADPAVCEGAPLSLKTVVIR